jgi:hypothetical protein
LVISGVSRRRRAANAGLVGLFVAVLAFGAVNILRTPTGAVASDDFTITSTVTDFPGCTSADTLYPDGPKLCLTYTVQNALTVPITVGSICIGPVVGASCSTSLANVTSPPGCDAAANLDLSKTGFTGSLNVPAGSSASTLPTEGLSIALLDTGSDQGACQNAKFTFTYSGTAKYSEQFPTDTALSSSPNPSSPGQQVTLTASVVPVGTPPGAPTGTVTFYSCANVSCSLFTLLGSAPVNAVGINGQATLNTSSLPGGADQLYATYSGDSGGFGDGLNNFNSSTSLQITQAVGVKAPPQCQGPYQNTIIGTPANPVIRTPNGSNFVFAFGTNYTITGGSGNDCVDAGDGNNGITDGNGLDVVLVGDGKNSVALGNGNDTVFAGSGANLITIGNGNNTVTLGNGTNHIAVGSGANTLSVGTGSGNKITLGNGTATVTLNGSNDSITAGNGNKTIYLGSGANNAFTGGSGTNICHLPAFGGLSGTALVAHYGDHLTNCTVVSS